MRKPAASRKAKPAPNVVIVDKVANLAAGLTRALQETGWSMRGLAQASGLTADRLRNVVRGRSTVLQGDAVALVAEVLGTTPGVLTGTEAWPDGGLQPRVKPEKRVREPVGGDLAELAADARQVAVAAREAVRIAIIAAEAAERIADRAEAALAVPAPSDDEIFERWGLEAEAELAARPPTSKAVSAAPSQPVPIPVAASPAPAAARPVPAADARYANVPRKRGKPPADLLDQLVWYTKPRVHTVDARRKQVTLPRKLGKGETIPSARIDVVKAGGFQVYSLEQERPVGESRDAQVAAWIAQDHVAEMERLADHRKRNPSGCDFVRAHGGDYRAELLGAEDIQAADSYRYVQVLAAMHQWYARLHAGSTDGQPLLGGTMVEPLAAARAWLQQETVAVLSSGSNSLPASRMPPAVRSVSTLSQNMRKQLATLKASGVDLDVPQTAVIVIERLCHRLQELESIIKQEEEADAAAAQEKSHTPRTLKTRAGKRV